MSATAQWRDFERISFQEDLIVSGFGKRQIVSTPVRSDASGPAGEAGLTADRLPFSFIGLAGAAAVSAALMLCVFYMIYPMILRIAEANLELSRMNPDVLKLGYSMMKWSVAITGVFSGVLYCVITHWIAYFLRRSDLWVFALTGLACMFLSWFFPESTAPANVQLPAGFQLPADLQRPFLASLLAILSGPATTSTYWLIAKWRAA